MIILSMDFYIPSLARKLFMGEDKKIDLGKVEASYEKPVLDELRNYPGLIWKVWAVSEDGRRGSGYYLFGDKYSAEIRRKFARRFYFLKGMMFVRCRMRVVIEGCSRYNRAPIDLPANPPMTKEQAEEILHPGFENPIKMFKHKRELIKKYERGESSE